MALYYGGNFSYVAECGCGWVQSHSSHTVFGARNAARASLRAHRYDAHPERYGIERGPVRHLPINAAPYTARERVRGWNVTLSPLGPDVRAAGRMLRARLHQWTPADHHAAAERFERAAARLRDTWGRMLDAAALATFGRPWCVTDYKISGIGRDEFPERVKLALRRAAHAQTACRTLAAAHMVAARRRRKG